MHGDDENLKNDSETKLQTLLQEIFTSDKRKDAVLWCRFVEFWLSSPFCAIINDSWFPSGLKFVWQLSLTVVLEPILGRFTASLFVFLATYLTVVNSRDLRTYHIKMVIKCVLSSLLLILTLLFNDSSIEYTYP